MSVYICQKNTVEWHYVQDPVRKVIILSAV